MVSIHEGRKTRRSRWYPIALNPGHISYNLAWRWSGKPTGVNAATDAVEARSVSRIGVRSNPTALIGSGADSTIHRANESSADGQCTGIRGGEAATGVGMERCLIVRIVIDAFDDIDFASSRPVRSYISISTEIRDNRGYTYRHSKRLAMCHTQPACAQRLGRGDRQ